MHLYIKTVENGWETERSMELPDDDKLLKSLLRTVKRFTTPQTAAVAEGNTTEDLLEPRPASEIFADLELVLPKPKSKSEVRTTFERQKYYGFLLVQCAGCRKTAATCARKPIDTFHCNGCGHDTSLDMLALAEFSCPGCGKEWKYKTNSEDADLVCQCVQCGTEMRARWKPKQRRYIPYDK